MRVSLSQGSVAFHFYIVWRLKTDKSYLAHKNRKKRWNLVSRIKITRPEKKLGDPNTLKRQHSLKCRESKKLEFCEVRWEIGVIQRGGWLFHIRWFFYVWFTKAFSVFLSKRFRRNVEVRFNQTIRRWFLLVRKLLLGKQEMFKSTPKWQQMQCWARIGNEAVWLWKAVRAGC